MTEELKAYVAGFTAAMGMVENLEYADRLSSRMHRLRVRTAKKMLDNDALAEMAVRIDGELCEVLTGIPPEELDL